MRTITKFAALAAMTFSLAFGHGGFDHVQGTVVKADKAALVVKTDKGDVNVKLDAKTELTKDGKSAKATDLTPGVRVVVDIPEGKIGRAHV